MSSKETHNTAVQTTTHYWGYREIDPSELKHVGGGDGSDYGDYGDYGDAGGMCDASAYSGPSGFGETAYAGVNQNAWGASVACFLGFESYCPSPSVGSPTMTAGVRG